MNKLLKNLSFSLFMLLFAVVTVSFGSSNEVLAANETTVAYYVQSYDGEDVQKYKDADKAPKPTEADAKYRDWIFAGWFTDDACKQALKNDAVVGTTYYAKYVPSEVLSVKCQVKEGTTADSTTKSAMRLVSTVDSLDYKRVGFEVYFNGAETPVIVNTTKVYKRIVAKAGGIDYDFGAKIFDTQSEYFVTATLVNISTANFDKGFFIKPYWETLDGTLVYGVERYARVEDSYLNIVNVPVRLYTDTEVTTGAFSVSYDADNFEYISDGYGTSNTPAYTNGTVFDEITVSESSTAGVLTCVGQSSSASIADGTYAHLRFQMLNPTTAPKNNVFTIDSESFINSTENVSVSIENVVYTYFFRTDTGSADTSWYDTDEDAYTLTSLDELIGFAELSNDNAFLDKTIYLGADITYHTGDASTWSTTAPTTYSGAVWDPIGDTSTYRFAGTFNGQGHTISGIYASGSNNQALFQRPAATAVIKDFSLKDSHIIISSTNDGFKFAGSIAGAGEGQYENIYSDAYVTCTGTGAGGFIGCLNIGNSNITINNCWYDGTIVLTTYGCRAGGFVGSVGHSGTPATSANLDITSCLYTGDIQYEVTNTSKNGIHIGGFIGCILNSSDVTIKDSLVAGTMTGLDSTADTGAIIGTISENSTVEVEDGTTYATTDVYGTIVGSGTITTGSVETVAEADTHSLGAYTSVPGLDFYDDYTGKSNDGYWVGRIEDTPALRSFVDSGVFCVPEVSWHDAAVRTDVIDGMEVPVYQIRTVQELYGFAMLSYTNNFAGEKIELGADLALNTGEATEWSNRAPQNIWLPIAYANGSGTEFAGIFDGCGHTIDGVYVCGENNLGLFGKTTMDSSISDFRLQNSCIISTKNNGEAYVGSVVGSGGGTFDTIYTNAIVHGKGFGIGGVIGCIRDGYNNTIANCWSDGTVNITITQDDSKNSMRIGGFIGRVCTTSSGTTTLNMNHCLYTGKISGSVYQTGSLIGNARGNAVVTIEDSFIAGDNQATGTSVGAAAGYLENSAQLTTDNTVYVMEGCCPSTANGLGTVGSKASNATANCSSDTVSASNTYNFGAFTNLSNLSFYSELDETGYWVARVDRLPVLKSFADTDNLFKIDTSWYDEPARTESDGTEVYEINNIEEFYGFAKLSYSNSFAGEKIELKTDIVANEGKASDWATIEPQNRWIPIGWQNSGGTAFAGTFDGCGHTISGIYVLEDNNLGLFGKTTGTAVLKNFYLENSYIASVDVTGYVHIGAIVGSGSGTFDTIYTDAIVSTNGREIGGFVGCVNVTDAAFFTNCWFDGTIYMNGNSDHGAGLVGSVGCLSAKKVANISVDNYLYTGLLEYHSTTAQYTRAAGMFGAILNGSTITLEDCLIAGKVDNCGNSDAAISATIGIVGGTATVNLVEGDDCYVTKATNSKLVGADTGSKLKNSEYLHQITDITTLYGATAQTTAPTLDYTTYWKTVSGNTPVLKCFESDTRWYNTTDTEFVINTVAEFYGFAELSLNNSFEGKTIKLGADLTINEGDASKWEVSAPDRVWHPIGWKSGNGTPFAGTFDGQGHTISGVYVSGGNNLGLFGKVTAKATLTNFRLVNSYITTTSGKTGNAFVGSIAGSGSGTYEKIYSDAIVKTSGNGVGGLVGCLNIANSTTTIRECWFNGIVQNHGTGYQAGGFVGMIGTSSATGVNVVVSDSLFTGIVDFASTGNYARVGGFAGIMQASSTAEISDSLFLGTITTLYPEKHHGALVGYVASTCSIAVPEGGDIYTSKETYTKLFGYEGSTTDEDGNVTAKCEITEEYIWDLNVKSDFHGIGAYLHGTSLDFDAKWMLREGTYPILTCFASATDVELEDLSCFESEGMIGREKFTDYGQCNYLKIQEETEKTYYVTYIDTLDGFGFDIVYSNAEGLDNGATYTTICQKDNLFFTVTYTSKTKTTYISVTTNLAMSEYLSEDYVTNNGGNETSADVSLSMLSLESAAGSNFIIQLENGHFVIYDSGETKTDRDNMIAYMKSLSGDETPIVDAWIISHVHSDHYGVLYYLDADSDGVIEDVYVQGVYINIPSQATFTSTGDGYSKVTSIESIVRKMRMTDGETVPTIYRMQTGQKYYFDGVTMDVMMTQEQTTGYTDLNDSSTWCMFTVVKSSEKIMMGGDAGQISMQKLMDIYSADYLYSDVFAGLHHGINTWETFTEYCQTNTICNGKAVDDVVLYSRKNDPTNINGYTIDEIGDIIKAINYVSVNNKLLTAVNKGINGTTHFYYGQGTICLTFGSTGITSEIIAQ